MMDVVGMRRIEDTVLAYSEAWFAWTSIFLNDDEVAGLADEQRGFVQQASLWGR